MEFATEFFALISAVLTAAILAVPFLKKAEESSKESIYGLSCVVGLEVKL